ncbi:MAG: hypothetical protein QW688_05445 [Thermoprotei archaeon]
MGERSRREFAMSLASSQSTRLGNSHTSINVRTAGNWLEVCIPIFIADTISSKTQISVIAPKKLGCCLNRVKIRIKVINRELEPMDGCAQHHPPHAPRRLPGTPSPCYV